TEASSAGTDQIVMQDQPAAGRTNPVHMVALVAAVKVAIAYVNQRSPQVEDRIAGPAKDKTAVGNVQGGIREDDIRQESAALPGFFIQAAEFQPFKGQRGMSQQQIIIACRVVLGCVEIQLDDGVSSWRSSDGQPFAAGLDRISEKRPVAA